MSRDFEEKMNSLIPMVVEQTSKGERAMTFFSTTETDLFSRTINDGSVFSDRATMLLEFENPNKEINFYINSPGGLVTAGLEFIHYAIYKFSSINTMYRSSILNGFFY